MCVEAITKKKPVGGPTIKKVKERKVRRKEGKRKKEMTKEMIA